MKVENVRLNLKITQTEEMLAIAQSELGDFEVMASVAGRKVEYFDKMLKYLKAERDREEKVL